MSMKTPEQITAFLDDLTEVTKKHGIKIHGCGCCGSPCLEYDLSEGVGYNVYATGSARNSDEDYYDSLTWSDTPGIGR